MSVQERRDRERQAVREKILAASRQLFARDGFDNVSMRQIAEAIEYSPTAIYIHFQDKESLFRELVSADFVKLRSAFQKIARVTDPMERLRQIGHAYIQFALKHPNHYRLMFMTQHHCGDQVEEKLTKGNPDEDAYAFVLWSAEEAVNAGCLRREYKNPQLIAQTLWAAVHGVASLQIDKGDDPWLDWRPVRERAETMVEAILRGIAATPRDEK